jgi:uncharacterized protein (TIGR00369 family)
LWLKGHGYLAGPRVLAVVALAALKFCVRGAAIVSGLKASGHAGARDGDIYQMAAPVLSVKEIEALLRVEFPQVFHAASGLSIAVVTETGCRVMQAFRETFIRPGGTISGPTMMALADFTMYVAVLAAAGPVPLAVTTNLNINFLRKPTQTDLIADARLLKRGKRLVVGEVLIYSQDVEEPVAHVTATYSIPPSH